MGICTLWHTRSKQYENISVHLAKSCRPMHRSARLDSSGRGLGTLLLFLGGVRVDGRRVWPKVDTNLVHFVLVRLDEEFLGRLRSHHHRVDVDRCGEVGAAARGALTRATHWSVRHHLRVCRLLGRLHICETK